MKLLPKKVVDFKTMHTFKHLKKLKSHIQHRNYKMSTTGSLACCVSCLLPAVVCNELYVSIYTSVYCISINNTNDVIYICIPVCGQSCSLLPIDWFLKLWFCLRWLCEGVLWIITAAHHNTSPMCFIKNTLNVSTCSIDRKHSQQIKP